MIEEKYTPDPQTERHLLQMAALDLVRCGEAGNLSPAQRDLLDDYARAWMRRNEMLEQSDDFSHGLRLNFNPRCEVCTKQFDSSARLTCTPYECRSGERAAAKAAARAARR